jgi:predicted nuclease with TOPRIM domain
MEALLEKEGKVENWNDDRLDELNCRVNEGFKRTATKEEMNQRFDEMSRRLDESDTRSVRFESQVEAQFGRVNDRLDKLAYTILGVFGAFAATAIATVIGNAAL